MFDIRYHLFYLCAVFLMMGFGILIGEAIYPHQVKAQIKTLDLLRQEATDAVQRSQTDQQQFLLSEQAIDSLRPALVRGKLTGKRVVIVLTGDYPDAAQSAANALEDAGAPVPTVVALSAAWASLDAQTTTASIAALAQLMAQGTASSPANQNERDSLESQGLISVTGDLGKPTHLYVLVGGYSDPAADPSAPLDIALLNALTSAAQNNSSIVGCEPLDAAVSVIQAYQNAGISTIDCIDQPLGQLDLPFALRGQRGDYGLSSTASRQLPPSLDGSESP